MVDNQFPEDEGKTRRRPRGSSAATPTAAEARAAQARAGQYVNSRSLLMDRGQAEYDRAVTRNATEIPRAPGGQLTGRGSPSMPAPPSPFGAAANTAGTTAATGARAVARGLVGRVPVVGDLANSRSAGSGSSMTSNPEAQRFLAEDAARRAGPGRADADMENPMPRPQMGSAIEREVVARKPRPNVRPNARMSPRGMSADDLNEISLATAQRRGGAEMESGRSGDIARRILAREGEQDRQREMENMKRGGPVKKMAKGGVVSSSASGSRDGCAIKGKTKGRMV